MDEVESALISVLLPIGSIRPWISDCLKSVERSSNNLNVELIVVLNNLTVSEQKKVSNLVNKIWKRDFQILVDESDNLADVLNAGICRASGQFIARIDDDDLMEPDRLSNQIKHLSRHPNTVLVGGSTKVIDQYGQQIRINNFPTCNDQIQRVIKFGNCFAHSTVMFQKKDVVRVGMYESKYLFAEDYHLWTKLAQIGEICNLDIPVGSYRLHESQLNLKKKITQVFSIKQIIQEIATEDYHQNHSPRSETIPRKGGKYNGNRFTMNSVILSRQYFAIARLFADDKQKINWKSIINLSISFLFNPVECNRMILLAKAPKSKGRLLI